MSIMPLSLLFSQTGKIRGYVYESEGSVPIPFANIVLEGTKFVGISNNDGFYQINDIPEGTYKLKVTSLGFSPITREVTIQSGKIQTMEFFMEPETQMLMDVVVDAERQQRQTKILTSVVTLEPKEIAQFSVGGEPDLVRAIQVLPGVITTGDQGGQLYIRGGAPIQNLTMLDGMILYQPFHSIGFFSVFDTDILQSADIYTAGFKAEYGSRTSSVMDIRTRAGNRKRLAGKISSSTFSTRALLEGPLGKKNEDGISPVSFLVSAKTSYLDKTAPIFYPYAETEFGKGELPFYFTDIYGKISSQSSNGSKINLFGFSFNDGVDFTPVQGINWNAFGFGGNFTVVPPSSPTVINGYVSYSKYDLNSTEIIGQPRRSTISGFNGGLDFTYFMRKADELKYGFQVIGYRTDLFLTNSVGRIVQDLQNTNELAGFFQYKFQANRLLLEPGLRLHYYSSLSEFSLEPRLGIKYNVNEKFRLKGSGGLYSQNLIAANSDRDVVNLFYGFIAGADDIPENFRGEPINSKLQRAWHAVIGGEYDVNEKLTLNLEGYIKNFTQITNINRNKLFESGDTEQPDYLRKSFIVEEGLAKGIDLLVKYNDRHFSLWLAYSLSEVTRTDELRTYYPVFDRRHNLNFVGTYKWDENKWEASVRWNFGSGFPFTPQQGFYPKLTFTTPDGRPDINYDYTTVNGDPSILYGDLNTKRLPDYHRMDISVTRHWSFGDHQKLDATFAVTNVYNRANIFYYNREEARRVDQLPILPTVILSYSF